MELRSRQFYVFAAFFPLLLAASSALFLGLPSAIVVSVGGFLSLMGLGSLAYAILSENKDKEPLPLWYVGLLVLCCINLFAFVAMSHGPGGHSDLVEALRSSALGYLGFGGDLTQAIVSSLVSLLVIVKIIRIF
jgi:hypothetical protein